MLRRDELSAFTAAVMVLVIVAVLVACFFLGIMVGDRTSENRLARCQRQQDGLREELQRERDAALRARDDAARSTDVAEALAAKLAADHGAAVRLIDECRAARPEWIPAKNGDDE